MKFSDIIGQRKLKERLARMVDLGRVPHAQLFTGPPGSGKLPLAIAYAQYLMCENRSSGDSCGVCPACRKVEKLLHPDLHFIFPDKAGERKSPEAEEEAYIESLSVWRDLVNSNPYFTEGYWYAELGLNNKQGVIATGRAGLVIRKLTLKSVESDYKVMVIWLPERMNAQSANKLLKLIEEPPRNTVFLLVSENPNRIINTIVSRTQRVQVPPLESGDIALALAERYGVAPEKAHDISRVAAGNWLEALALQEGKGNRYFECYSSLMRLSFKRDFVGLVNWAKELAADYDREELKQFLLYSLKLLRESMVAKVGLSELSHTMGGQSEFAVKFSPYIELSRINDIASEFNQAYTQLVHNGNPKIILPHMAIGMARYVATKPVD